MSKFNESYNEYYRIIEEARALERAKLNRDHLDYEYFENHHVIPKSLGGSNSWRNMVLLTPEEHYICHSLLPDFCEGPAYYLMTSAWQFMNNTRKIDGIKVIGSEKYGVLKREFAINHQEYLINLYETEEGKEILEARNKKMQLFWQTEEGKENLRKQAEKRTGEKSVLSISILKLNLETGTVLEEFPSLGVAQKSIDHGDISHAIQSYKFTAGGFAWIQKKDYTIKFSDLVKQYDYSKSSLYTPVYQRDLNTKKFIARFETIVLAKKAVGKGNQGISAVVRERGSQKTAAGYGWEKVANYSKEEQREIELAFS